MTRTDKINRRARSFIRDITERIKAGRNAGATLVPVCRVADRAAQTLVAKKAQQYPELVLVEHNKLICVRVSGKVDGRDIVYRPETTSPPTIEERLADIERRVKNLEEQR